LTFDRTFSWTEDAAMSTAPATVKELLRAGADDSSALSAPGRPPLRYSDLRSLVADTAGALNARGIGSNDRVAMVLDNGPEAASAFIAIAGAASAAPLNPSYRTEEFQFYLTDLRPRLLVVAAGKETPALDVAARLGVPVARLEIAPDARAGAFTLGFADPAPAAAVSPARAAPPTAADEALVLHTSGTTSRPKIGSRTVHCWSVRSMPRVRLDCANRDTWSGDSCDGGRRLFERLSA